MLNYKNSFLRISVIFCMKNMTFYELYHRVYDFIQSQVLKGLKSILLSEYGIIRI